MKSIFKTFIGVALIASSTALLPGCSAPRALTLEASNYTVTYGKSSGDKPQYKVNDGNDVIAVLILDGWTYAEEAPTIASGSNFGIHQLSLRSDYRLRKFKIGDNEMVIPKTLSIDQGGTTNIAYANNLQDLPNVIASQTHYSIQAAEEVKVTGDLKVELDIVKLGFFEVEKWQFVGAEVRVVTEDNPREGDHYLGAGKNEYADTALHQVIRAGDPESEFESCSYFFKSEINHEPEFTRTYKKTGASSATNVGYVVPPMNEGDDVYSMINNKPGEGIDGIVDSVQNFTLWLGNLCFETEISGGRTMISYYSPVNLKSKVA